MGRVVEEVDVAELGLEFVSDAEDGHTEPLIDPYERRKFVEVEHRVELQVLDLPLLLLILCILVSREEI